MLDKISKFLCPVDIICYVYRNYVIRKNSLDREMKRSELKITGNITILNNI